VYVIGGNLGAVNEPAHQTRKLIKRGRKNSPKTHREGGGRLVNQEKVPIKMHGRACVRKPDVCKEKKTKEWRSRKCCAAMKESVTGQDTKSTNMGR